MGSNPIPVVANVTESGRNVLALRARVAYATASSNLVVGAK